MNADFGALNVVGRSGRNTHDSQNHICDNTFQVIIALDAFTLFEGLVVLLGFQKLSKVRKGNRQNIIGEVHIEITGPLGTEICADISELFSVCCYAC